ncbi:MAG TPA: hypothetical protein VLE70_22250 [Anaerolineae bacterium]|jgi:ABC-type phosphate transport system permease subunit|nr:hypothetical protein [Anaerolineae bacterium]
MCDSPPEARFGVWAVELLGVTKALGEIVAVEIAHLRSEMASFFAFRAAGAFSL